MKQEFLNDVLQKKPRVIVLPPDDYHLDAWYNPIFDMIDNEYRLLSEETGYTLFIRGGI
ncbi:hypothetical protein AGMMS50268_37800 [Spirochaetia bacterium]|nr:hypothetical protein AGMMS50268_37800 [Spirochaetia bacterium]